MKIAGLNKQLLGTTGEKAGLWVILYFIGYLQWDLRWFCLAVISGYLFYLWWLKRKNKNGPPVNSGIPVELAKLDLPAWVLHPDTQRANWTNVIFKQLWPHLEEFLKNTLKTIENDENLQERLQGYHIKSIRFPRVSLGKIPPKLSGVKVHKSVHRDEIILDLNIQYNGDLLIDMEAILALSGVTNYVPPVYASIRNMSFSGSLR